MRFFLPFPPSSNNYRVPVRGRLILSTAARHYFKSAAVALAQQKIGREAKMTGRIQVEIELCPPDMRRRDLENAVKQPLDAIVKAGVINDDSQIDDLRIWRGAPCVGGRVWVTVSTILAAFNQGGSR